MICDLYNKTILKHITYTCISMFNWKEMRVFNHLAVSGNQQCGTYFVSVNNIEKIIEGVYYQDGLKLQLSFQKRSISIVRNTR